MFHILFIIVVSENTSEIPIESFNVINFVLPRFMTLAGYIGVRSEPQNERREAIAMTAPVVSVHKPDGGPPPMQFILPADTQANAPRPTSADCRLVSREAKFMVVKTFSGTWSPDVFEQQRDELLRFLREQAPDVHAKLKSPLCCETYRYNPPWTLSFMRTNEVAIQIEEVEPCVQGGK